MLFIHYPFSYELFKFLRRRSIPVAQVVTCLPPRPSGIVVWVDSGFGVAWVLARVCMGEARTVLGAFAVYARASFRLL